MIVATFLGRVPLACLHLVHLPPCVFLAGAINVFLDFLCLLALSGFNFLSLFEGFFVGLNVLEVRGYEAGLPHVWELPFDAA
jgi:hypothetical protein